MRKYNQYILKLSNYSINKYTFFCKCIFKYYLLGTFSQDKYLN